MKFQYQTRPHPNGDCMRACLASLLEVPILNVPDFTLIEDNPEADPDDYPEWYKALQNFVADFGYVFVEIQMDKKTWMPLPADVLAIFMGPHESGCKHAIIGRCIDGQFFPVFDPLGAEAPPFTTVEAVCFLVPLDPMMGVRMGRALVEIIRTAPGISNKIVADAITDAARAGLGERMKIESPAILGPDGKAAKGGG